MTGRSPNLSAVRSAALRLWRFTQATLDRNTRRQVILARAGLGAIASASFVAGVVSVRLGQEVINDGVTPLGCGIVAAQLAGLACVLAGARDGIDAVALAMGSIVAGAALGGLVGFTLG